MKAYLAALLLMALPRVEAESQIYTYSELSKWENLEKPLLEECPGATRVYELFDKMHDVAIKVYLDPKTPRAFVVHWAREETVVCKKNGEVVPAKDVFTPLQVDMFGIIVSYDLDGQKRIVDDHDRTQKSTVGHWFQRPEKGDLTLDIGSKAGDFIISWAAGEQMPKVSFHSVEQRLKIPNKAEMATPRKPSD